MNPSRDLRVSVVIPAFNSERLVAAAVQSVLAQMLPAHEIIAVDDGSTDGTARALEAFRPAVSVIRQANGGAGRARNAGARVATGDWIAFLDADDEWKPDKLRAQARYIAEDVALIYSDRFNCGDRGALPPRAGMHLDLSAGETLRGLLRDNVITTSTVLLRREVFERLGGFSEDLRVVPAEDWDLWLRVLGSYRARLCPEPLIDYRFHKASISRKDLRMNRARLLVMDRALSSPACADLGWAERRQIRSVCWLHNSYDAYRAGQPATSALCCLRAAALYPLRLDPWRNLVRIVLGRM